MSKDIILFSDAKIAGGTHAVLNKNINLGKKDEAGTVSVKEMAEKLGFLTKLPIESVYSSFRQLVGIKITDHTNSKLLDYAKAFYRYLGRLKVSDIPEDITGKSIFIDNRWVPSRKVFQRPINLTGIYDWNSLVGNGQDPFLSVGLMLLGVLEKPDIEYFIHHLNGLPIDEKLEGHQLKDAKIILYMLQNNSEEFRDIHGYETIELPLLSKDDKLISSSNLYINDLPAYKTADKRNDDLALCQNQFDTLAKSIDVVSLVDNVVKKLNYDDSEFISESELDPSFRPENHIMSGSFKGAILRLKYHEGKISEEKINHDALDNILPSEIHFMRRLVVDNLIADEWLYTDNAATTYVDEFKILYILDQEDIEDMCESISTYICDAGGLRRESYIIIDRILRLNMDRTEIEKILDKRNIKALPEELSIGDDYSIYGDLNEQDDTDSIASTYIDSQDIDTDVSSGSEYEEFPESAEGSENAEDDIIYRESTPSFPPSSKGSHNGEEIPPPIKPKASSEAENKETSSKDKASRNQSGKGSYSGGNSKRTSTPSEKSISPNDRKPVYVGSEKIVDTNTHNDKKNYAKEVGNKGENYVLSKQENYVLSKTNSLIKASVNNEGFDLCEYDSSENLVRYVEVKTLTGRWGEGGVGITKPQLRFAQKNSNWWLFVVENVHTDNTVVHTFKNPILEANKFVFDSSWKQLASNNKKLIDITVPEVGDFYDLGEDDDIYEILEVTPKGKFFLVELRGNYFDRKLNKKFNAAWVKQ